MSRNSEASEKYPEGLTICEAASLRRSASTNAAFDRITSAADVPPSPTLDALRHSITTWLTHALERGRDLGQIDLDTPLELQLHLLIAVLTEVDRWVLAHNANTDSTSAALRVLERLLVA